MAKQLILTVYSQKRSNYFSQISDWKSRVELWLCATVTADSDCIRSSSLNLSNNSTFQQKMAMTMAMAKKSKKSKKKTLTPKLSKSVKSRAQFVFKLHDMICKENGDIVQWIDGGSAFLIKDPSLFAKRLLPVYCGHKTFTSFERQMNFYRYVKM